jgi:hypothetical protein
MVFSSKKQSINGHSWMLHMGQYPNKIYVRWTCMKTWAVFKTLYHFIIFIGISMVQFLDYDNPILFDTINLQYIGYIVQSSTNRCLWILLTCLFNWKGRGPVPEFGSYPDGTLNLQPSHRNNRFNPHSKWLGFCELSWESAWRLENITTFCADSEFSDLGIT